MKTKCIIVDDEPLAIEIIESYLKDFPAIEIVATCTDAMKAFEILRQTKIDLIFLDIKMPQISGIRFLRSLNDPPAVILTTAYREYAIDGFDLNVIDYLLKPIEFERFLQAIDKYYRAAGNREVNSINHPAAETKIETIFVKSDRKMMQLPVRDIYLIESMKDYVTIYLKNDKIITKETISYFEKTLPQNEFIRIHRAYIAAAGKIKAVTADSVEILNRELPIGRKYKPNIQVLLNSSH